MSNPFYQEMMQRQLPQNAMAQEFMELVNNPVQAIARRRLNIPPGVNLDPTSIAQYLLNSGQVPQWVYNAASQTIQNFVKMNQR